MKSHASENIEQNEQSDGFRKEEEGGGGLKKEVRRRPQMRQKVIEKV